ncbi:alpha/beta hydrolase family protein [Stenotrophobium rhamnosiphilum]|uniref:Peptidase S9 n=1 Tax=Stenotrophobium rhamnosiphilum TaxID=2029166 RepID=A0A2T5MJP3_9GAMM|nr:S9 family peptidase [Stenotrophobium rhamnosiphilum]PTU32803.1 peptidase S9 [Stenotrophobium rhamnosiphilum]
MKAFTVQDLVTLERISDPRVSPDGHVVAYVVRETDLPNNKGTRNIWLLELNNAQAKPRKLTNSTGNSDTPRWSADGKSIYFSSTRSGSTQIWRLDMSGGEAQQVTDLPLDVNAFVLSPNGKRIALSMEVFIDAKDSASTKKRLDEVAAKKSTGTVYDKLFMRHWDTWSNGTRAQLFVASFDSSGVVSAEPKLLSRGIDGDVPSKPFGDDSEITWSPDSKTLAFDARVAGTTEAWSTNLDIFTVPADGSAKPVNHTADNLATDVSPLFTPDGQSLIYKAMKHAGFEADRLALMIKNLKTGTTREIAPNWDRSADAYALSADGKTIYCTADDLGQKPLFAIDVATGKVDKLTGDGTVSGFGLGEKDIVYALNSLQSPDQLYRISYKGGVATQLTHTNAAQLNSIQLGDAEQFHFKGWNKETVYGYVVKPWNYHKGKKYPVALIIHGGPQGSMANDWHYRWNPQTYAGQGYAVVFIDFHGSTGYGQAFTDSISGDWGGKPLEDLQKGWKYALEKYDFLDGSKAAALGASYGGFMINWIEGNWQDTFKCLVNHNGVFDNRMMTYSTEELWFDEWEMGGVQYEKPENFEKHNPINHVSKWKTPMLVIHSAQDFRVPMEQGIGAFTALQRRGVPSEFLTFPDENHWVLKPQNSVQWHETVNAWLKRWIGS